MSFALSNLSFFHSKNSRVIVFFFIFLSFAALCLFSTTLVQRNSIQQLSITLLENSLKDYLQQNNHLTPKHFSLQNTPPQQLDFIRLIKGKDQLLITAAGSINFTGLIDLDPFTHGAWIDLSDPAKPGSWILISKTLDDGSRVQAGTDDRSGLALYQETTSNAYRLLLLVIFPCLVLALFFSAIMKSPLRSLQDDIQTALEQKSLPLLKTVPKHHDLQPLYQLLEETFLQNRQLIKEMQSSLDNVAHDLRTPMTRLRAVAEYALQSDKEDSGLYRSALSDCLEESERVLAMLKVMMSVAEAEAGTLELRYEELNIRETLEDVIALYQYVSEEEQITVSLECPDNIFIPADKTRISQVWANILDNAIKYGYESGTVIIRVSTSNHHVIVSFIDNGMGISETETDRIWDRLYRGDRSRSKLGLGLGLNYVKAVVEAHQGQVVVRSTIKEGSTFTVHLPMRPDPVKRR